MAETPVPEGKRIDAQAVPREARTSVRPEREARGGALARSIADGFGIALDFVSDWAVLSFASWTVFAYLGMITGARVSLLVPIWLLSIPVLGVFLLLPRFRLDRASDAAGQPDIAAPSAPARTWVASSRTLLLVGLGAGFLGAALAAHPGNLPWAVVWIPAFIAAAAAVAAGKLGSRATAIVREQPGWPAHLFAAAVGVLFAAMSLFTARGNADDAFYVNRASAVRQLDHIPVLDVIFTHEQVARSGGAGLPVDSYSALQGGLARLLGVQAPSVAYFLFPPVFTFLAVWAVWRLIRTWAPRNALLCFVLGAVFWIWSAQYPLTSGSYFLARIWQGKVALVAWLIPVLYVYLTRWMGKRDALTAVLMLTAGFCSIGLTGSATFVTPLVVLAAVIPLVARMEWRALPVPLGVAAIPFLIGVFVLSRYPLAESIGKGAVPAQAWFYHQVVGTGLVALVAAFGLWAAPWMARAGPPTRLVTGLVVVVALLIAPGSIALVGDVSGLNGTLRRLLWIIPFPALVGLLAAMPVTKRFGRWLPVGATAAVCALLVVFGTPLWMIAGRSVWHYPPRWHISKANTVHAILQRYHGDGPVLSEKTVMLSLATLTAEPKAVDARTHYLIHTRLPHQEIADRIALTDFIMEPEPQPTPAVRRAFANLDVGLVCVAKYHPHSVPVIESLGFKTAFKVPGEFCLLPVESGSG